MKAQLIAFAAVASLDTNQEVPEKEEVRKRFYNKSQRVGCGNDKEATERDLSIRAWFMHFRLQAR